MGAGATAGDDGGDGPRRRLTLWLLLDGDRLVVAGGAVAVVFLLTFGLVRAGAIAVGPNSVMPSLFGSAIAGLLTLITVTLTINQLILSRVFGTPKKLGDQLDGSRRFRRSVRDLADRRSVPNDPTAFLSLVGATLYERATTLRSAVADLEGTDPDLTDQLSTIVSLSESMRELDPGEVRTVTVLEDLLGPKFARSLSAADHVGNACGDRLPEDARDDLDAVNDLLEAFAITRQYYKTLALQQALAELSRLIAYVGFVSILAAVYVALVYRTNGSVAVDPRYLPWLASAGIAVVFAPLAVLLAFVLRIATISRYTVSVGAFVPPRETFGGR